MSDPSTTDKPAVDLVARHLRIGWWGLLVFLSLGLVLEALHGLKVGAYLDADQETRRLMWRLAHAHGTLLSLVHLALAATVAQRPGVGGALASRCLTASLVLMPAGFLLGGAWTHGGDPGLGISLVPPGGLLLLVAVGGVARGVTGRGN